MEMTGVEVEVAGSGVGVALGVGLGMGVGAALDQQAEKISHRSLLVSKIGVNDTTSAKVTLSKSCSTIGAFPGEMVFATPRVAHRKFSGMTR